MCHTYILYSSIRDKYYVGSTCDNLAERINKHNTNQKGFTGGTGDWTLVHSEPYPNVSMARKRENEIKAWKSRKMIEALIANSSNGDTGLEHPD
jgi:putative endonuclease